MTQSGSAKLLTPLIAAGAMIALGAAWFAPLPEPQSSQPVVRIGPADSSEDADAAQVRAVGTTPDHDWLALAEPLNRLREPLVPIEPPETGPDPDPIEPPPPIRYLGLVSTSTSKAAALIEIGGQQRFISTGDIVVDESRGDLVVKEITPEKIIFERSGIETTIMRENRQDQNPGGRTPQQPGPDPANDPSLGGTGIR
jgi:hypothetical protein